MPIDCGTTSAATRRPLSVAIAALGGQGGGMLADWIVEVAESFGWLVQSTSVPGVAQRTGTTIYYLEMCRRPPDGGAAPVFALMPVPGDVDVVVAAELMEAGRAVLRGFVSPERTTLVASGHRVYAISEKSSPGNAIADESAVLRALRSEARRLVCFDMEPLCAATGSVISSVLCGALAASGALPFPRELYEQAIRRAGVAVDANLAGFAAGFDRALNPEDSAAAVAPAPAPSSDAGRRLDAAVRATFPAQLHDPLIRGVRRLMDYQDAAYADDYLRRQGEVLEWDRAAGGAGRGFVLTAAVARHLAEWMSFEDTIRIADLKTRRERFQRCRSAVGAGPDQIVELTEYVHPRFQELCDTLPAALGRRLAASPVAARWLTPLFRRGRRLDTAKLSGFVPLYLLAGLRRWRRGTLRYQIERAGIDAWLDRIRTTVCASYDVAVEVAECQGLVKGYGDTRERGLRNFAAVMHFVDGRPQHPELAAAVRSLRSAALADADGGRLDSMLHHLAAGDRGRLAGN